MLFDILVRECPRGRGGDMGGHAAPCIHSRLPLCALRPLGALTCCAVAPAGLGRRMRRRNKQELWRVLRLLEGAAAASEAGRGVCVCVCVCVCVVCVRILLVTAGGVKNLL